VNALGHLVDMYADATDIDLGERELGLAQAFDHELDNVSASLAFISTFISNTMKDEGKFFLWNT
jgi:dynactin 1